ncbi:MAG TPA: hypothetical protein VEQ60_17200 [Longimicrobium sp.]|nr:hypothetical protein [Longimicrobium sp.]
MNRILSLQGMSLSYTEAAENSGVSATCAGNSCISYNCGSAPAPKPPATN